MILRASVLLFVAGAWPTSGLRRIMVNALATPPTGAPRKATAPNLCKKNVFVTGATGMVGSAVVRDLLDQDPDCHVGCLVRGKSREDATVRVQDAMARYGLEYDEARVEAIPGDVTEENLGMRMGQQHGCGTAAYGRKHNWDAVVHCAASTKLMEETEVNSLDVIRRVVDFTAAASLDNSTTLHYMSSVAACLGDPDIISISENHDLPPSAAFPGGYGIDKYNAEAFIRKEAALRNIDTYIYRAPFITSRYHSQMHSVPDILLKLGLLTGSLPRFKSYLPVCTLRSVSKSIAACVLGHHGTTEESTARIYTLHLVDTEPAKWDDQFSLLRSALRPYSGNVEEVTLPEFQRRMKSIQKVHHYAGVLRKLSPIIDLFAKYDFPQVQMQQTVDFLSRYGYDRTKDNISLADVSKAASLSYKSLEEKIGHDCIDEIIARATMLVSPSEKIQPAHCV